MWCHGMQFVDMLPAGAAECHGCQVVRWVAMVWYGALSAAHGHRGPRWYRTMGHVGFHGAPEGTMGFHVVALGDMGRNGVPSRPGVPMDAMGFHKVSWGAMG